jgi:hypothetical protein
MLHTYISCISAYVAYIHIMLVGVYVISSVSCHVVLHNGVSVFVDLVLSVHWSLLEGIEKLPVHIVSGASLKVLD